MSDIKVPTVIYLIDDDPEPLRRSWCDSPDPEVGIDAEKAIKYVLHSELDNKQVEIDTLKDIGRAGTDMLMILTTERDKLKAENERLRGIKPELPCDYYPTEDLPRFGINWNGPKTPLSIPMSDGYWTPYHFAKAMIENIRGR